MKWLLIVTVIFSDGDRYTGPLTADVYTREQCRAAAKDIEMIVDTRFKVLAATCVTTEGI